MKIVIAVDSFKESLASYEVADCIEKGIKKVYVDAEIIKVPIADGGEGTVDALVYGMGGRFVEVEVSNPLGERINSKYGILLDEKRAIIEMATASGLALVAPQKRNPLKTTTYGTGEMIKDAIKKGCRRFIVGIGGSATNDAGMGMMQALGMKFLDVHGQEVGEGRMDAQSLMGKAPLGVAKLAKLEGVPIISLSGAIADNSEELLHKEGIDVLFSIMNAPMSLEEALNPQKAKVLVEKKTEEIFRLIKMVQNHNTLNG